MQKLPLFLAISLAPFASAATLITAGVTVTETFGSAPAVADWGTKPMTSLALADATAFDTSIQNFTVSGLNTLASVSGTTLGSAPGSNSSARYATDLGALHTHATGGGYVPLVATVKNSTGVTLDSVSLAYDFNASGTGGGPLPGYRVYYSTTGLANSWINIPSFNNAVTVQAYSTSIAGLNLANDSNLYVLWADDDYDGISEPGYTLDNVSWTGVTAVPEPSTYGLMGAGALAATAFVRRRRKVA